LILHIAAVSIFSLVSKLAFGGRAMTVIPLELVLLVLFIDPLLLLSHPVRDRLLHSVFRAVLPESRWLLLLLLVERVLLFDLVQGTLRDHTPAVLFGLRSSAYLCQVVALVAFLELAALSHIRSNACRGLGVLASAPLATSRTLGCDLLLVLGALGLGGFALALPLLRFDVWKHVACVMSLAPDALLLVHFALVTWAIVRWLRQPICEVEEILWYSDGIE
jgi:hypothetical protein